MTVNLARLRLADWLARDLDVLRDHIASDSVDLMDLGLRRLSEGPFATKPTFRS